MLASGCHAGQCQFQVGIEYVRRKAINNFKRRHIIIISENNLECKTLMPMLY